MDRKVTVLAIVKILFYQRVIFINKFLALRNPPFIAKDSKVTGERCIHLPVMISKGEHLCFPKGMDLKFKRMAGKVSDQGILRFP